MKKPTLIVGLLMLSFAAWATPPCWTNLNMCAFQPTGCPYMHFFGTNVPSGCFIPGQWACLRQDTNGTYASLCATPVGRLCPFQGISDGPEFYVEVKCPTCCRGSTYQTVAMFTYNTVKDGLSHTNYVLLPEGYCGVSFILYEIPPVPPSLCGSLAVCLMSFSKPCSQQGGGQRALRPDDPELSGVIPYWIYP